MSKRAIKSKKLVLKRSFRIGREIIADLKGCDSRVIDDEQLLKRLVQEAVKTTKHHLLDISSRKFAPVGVTVVGILAESHISLHTYPEIGYVGIDIFTCGANKPEPILEYLQEKFGAKEVYWEFVRRGTMRQWKTIFSANGYKREIEVTRLIHKQTTPYQVLEIVRTKNLGTCLFADGFLQMSTLDTQLYDEQMIKELNGEKNILIVGGGDCSILKEIVKKPNLREIYMFEQDQQVVEVAKKYLGARAALRDPRLKMFYGDALQTIPYLKDKKIDYAVIDLVSFTESRAKTFYIQLFELLSNIGVKRWATQAGHFVETSEAQAILSAAKKFYKNIRPEEKWFLSFGMWRFFYGQGIKRFNK